MDSRAAACSPSTLNFGREAVSRTLAERADDSSRNVTAKGAERTGDDGVEAALAKALTEASAAGRFDVVALLAGELQARRLARAGVEVLRAQRQRRGP